jgi:cobalt-precorrin 5A hydrolase
MSVLRLDEEGLHAPLPVNGDYAIVAITKRGAALAGELARLMPDGADAYIPAKFANDGDGRRTTFFEGRVRHLLPALFQDYKGIIAIMSLGALVRMIAPLLKDKYHDPAVVVMDEAAKHVISVLSGHVGGANGLTQQIAGLLGADPVITTASDVQQTVAVDLLGKSFGWVLEPTGRLTAISAAVVNEEPVAIVQESGEREWLEALPPLSGGLRLYGSLSDEGVAKSAALLFISHRLLPADVLSSLPDTAVYRPKVIALGIGCNKGTSMEELESVVAHTLESELGLSVQSVKAVCTIDIKREEPGLVALCAKYGWELVCYSADELNQVSVEAPSDTVFEYTGAYAVSEPAAKLYTGQSALILTKKKSGNATISVGLISR